MEVMCKPRVNCHLPLLLWSGSGSRRRVQEQAWSQHSGPPALALGEGQLGVRVCLCAWPPVCVCAPGWRMPWRTCACICVHGTWYEGVQCVCKPHTRGRDSGGRGGGGPPIPGGQSDGGGRVWAGEQGGVAHAESGPGTVVIWT